MRPGAVGKLDEAVCISKKFVRTILLSIGPWGQANPTGDPWSCTIFDVSCSILGVQRKQDNRLWN